ncbi:MAG: 2'-5' RNA ligase family protein [Anaerolineae bacterium]|nr:2'-5' RNA ligase family protein [Anaerolineae bacterium]
MPYTNIPRALWGKADRLVKRLTRRGYSKDKAVAIAYSSIVGTKEARSITVTLKAPNYGARAGQTIAGALGRGSDGRFVRAGGPNLANLSPIARANKPKPKKGKAQPNAASISKAGEGVNGKALIAFAGGGSLSDTDGAALESKGLVERSRDGSFKLSSAGRSLLRASARNDTRGMQDALATGRDRVAAAGERQTKRALSAQQKLDKQAARKVETARRRAEAEAKRAQRESARQVKAEQRKAAQRQKVENRIEETQAKLEAEGLSEDKRLTLTNRLEELQAQLATLKEGHTGAMVALFVPVDVAKGLVNAAVTSGVDDVDVTPVDEVHLTLAYLGKAADIENYRIPLQKALSDFARNEPPITGKINGVGRFDGVEDGELNAYYASFDAPALPDFRQRLMGAIQSTGIPLEITHGFTPHITLAYLPVNDKAPDIKVPADNFTVDEVVLAWAGERAAFKLEGEPEQSGMVVVKQSDGQYRWITYSSNSFEDTDREIITQKALEDDIARTDTDGNYGPLRWWHCGEYAFKEAGNWESIDPGPGLDLGECDFSAMHGRILIESGTFRHPAIGAAMKQKASQLQVSLGLVHPPVEPVGGIYTRIRRFERSALPRGKAANLFTGVSVATPATAKESNMNAVKLAALKTLLGDDYEAVAAVLKGAEATEAQATEAGVRFKEANEQPKTEPEPTPGTASPERGKPEAGATEADNAATVKEAPSAGGPPASPPDAASAEGESESESASEGEAEGEEDVTFIGDMTPDEFMQLIVSGISQALQPLMEAMQAQTKAASEAVTKEAKAQIDGMGTLAASLKQVSDRLKELEGDAPKGGFRASESTGTITTPPTLKQQSEDDLAKLAGFMIKG